LSTSNPLVALPFSHLMQCCRMKTEIIYLNSRKMHYIYLSLHEYYLSFSDESTVKRCQICLISLSGLSLTFNHSGNGDWGFKNFLYGILLTLIEHVWLKLVTGKGSSAWRPKRTSAHMKRVTRHILLQLYIPNKIMATCNSESKTVRNKELHTKTHLIFYDQISIWWANYTLITNLVHWLLFIHKMLFSSTCFEHQVLIFRRTYFNVTGYRNSFNTTMFMYYCKPNYLK
jgi:hypothetical protein